MKKFAMLMLCLVLVFALAACAGTDTTPQGSVSDTVTVTDMKGEVAIPANPQRIVDVAGLTEELLILDMKVIASANTSMFDGVSVPKHLATLFAERGIEVVGNYSGSSSSGDLNLEKIAELKPDLIIMNIRHEKVYEQLAAIAPTVMIDDDISYVNWRGRFQQLGQWFDKEAAVEKWLADYDAKAAELAVRGLEAVDLRNGARDDDRHRVGHIVRLQRIGNALLDHVRAQAEDVGVIAVQSGLFLLFVLLHGVPRTFTYSVIMDYISFSARRQCVGAAQSVVCSLPHCTKGANVFRVSWLKSHLAFSSPVLYHLQKKQTREDTAMTQYVYKKKFLPAGVSIFISIVFVDNDIVSFDR